MDSTRTFSRELLLGRAAAHRVEKQASTRVAVLLLENILCEGTITKTFGALWFSSVSIASSIYLHLAKKIATRDGSKLRSYFYLQWWVVLVVHIMLSLEQWAD